MANESLSIEYHKAVKDGLNISYVEWIELSLVKTRELLEMKEMLVETLVKRVNELTKVKS